MVRLRSQPGYDSRNELRQQRVLPDWPKLSTWPDAYYVTMDLLDPNENDTIVGVVACAFDRTDMLTGSASPLSPQCFKVATPLSNGIYLGHSLIPADVDGTTAPPTGRDQFMVSIENPTNDGVATTSTTFKLMGFPRRLDHRGQLDFHPRIVAYRGHLHSRMLSRDFSFHNKLRSGAGGR